MDPTAGNLVENNCMEGEGEMSLERKTSRSLWVAAFLILLFLPGCGKREQFDKKDVIAYVNKEPILESELKRDIALKTRQDPMFKVTPETESEMLDNIINRKLLCQNAMEKGMAREPRFVNTIKSFWEQTLIRDFIDYKQKEFGEYTFVTEDEIKNYYDNLVKNGATESLDALRTEIEGTIIDEKETRLFEDWLNGERAKAKIKIIKK